ncbi:Crp/Fnr family transcriptional regulator [Maribellus sp. CM-23]|uniref:Crp/Fnr family transcriptional regulator n=1 Tax=Maribellus sp. CM-23 TaxID=2781026 RepID=UPI001F46519F|nr:Crp/Fnr family transcriptional regulator [Maribellus sp. CM-23]MCE4562762.1 Crp/Fnr family transcriptional regulator [Maribellus sp. CM-23]
MIDKLINTIKDDKDKWNQFQHILIEKNIASKTVLLHEGEISNNIFFIKSGCLREWFNKDGKDITFQFFFEGQPVASIDSFINREPSLFAIESIEPTTIITIEKADFENLLISFPELKMEFQNFIFQRFRNYGQLFLSRIKNSPKERYEELIKNHPEFIKRIPQHYIASFLGITPISLSRIRNRK